MPEILLLCKSSEALKLCERARLIGMIALNAGINKPMANACIDEKKEGKISSLVSWSLSMKNYHIAQIQGTESANPSTIDGNTNIAA